MADSTGGSFHSAPGETNQPLPLVPQQEAHASLTSLTSQSSAETSQKKKRGRPAGSKNKSKSSGIIAQEIESATKTMRIEIPYGHNIVDVIEKFARHHCVGVNVENGSGYIAYFSFENSTTVSSGVFKLKHMSGTFVDSSIMDVFPSSSSSGGEFSSFPYFGPWLRIGCIGADDKLIAGIVTKNVMVFSDVVVVHVSTFKSCGSQALDPAEYATEGESGAGFFGRSSSSSIHPSGGGVGDSVGSLLGGVLGGGVRFDVPTQQQIWNSVTGKQLVQRGGRLFDGSSNLSTHPSDGGLGGVGDSSCRILGSAKNSGVLGGGTKQQNWGFPVEEQLVQHEGGLFGGSSNLSTHPSGGGLGGVGDTPSGILGGNGNIGVLGGGTQQQNRDFLLMAQQAVQHGGGHFGGRDQSSSLSTHPSGGGPGRVGESARGILGGGGNDGVLGDETQQQILDFFMEQRPLHHEGLFGGSSSLSTHPSGGGLGGFDDYAGGLLSGGGGGGNSGVIGGGTQQQNWGLPMGEQSAQQHGGGLFGGYSSLSAHPSGGGLGEVGESGSGGGNGGVLGDGVGHVVPTEQLNGVFLTVVEPVQHEGGHLAGSSGLSTHSGGGGLGEVGDSTGGLLGGASGGEFGLSVPSEELDWDDLMEYL